MPHENGRISMGMTEHASEPGTHLWSLNSNRKIKTNSLRTFRIRRNQSYQSARFNSRTVTGCGGGDKYDLYIWRRHLQRQSRKSFWLWFHLDRWFVICAIVAIKGVIVQWPIRRLLNGNCLVDEPIIRDWLFSNRCDCLQDDQIDFENGQNNRVISISNPLKENYNSRESSSERPLHSGISANRDASHTQITGRAIKPCQTSGRFAWPWHRHNRLSTENDSNLWRIIAM